MISGKVPLEEELDVMRWNDDTNVHYLEKSMENAINIALLKHKRGNFESKCALGLQKPLYRLDLPLESAVFSLRKVIILEKCPENIYNQYL